jgi:murein DD-endopeptidase MepM/ murein hydrolase activator NlpD
MSCAESYRIVALALIALSVAGCSNATRFDDNPFANPYSAKGEPRRGEATGSAAMGYPPSSSRIEGQPLPDVQSYQALPPPPSRRTAEYTSTTAGGSAGIVSYNTTPSRSASSDITGAVYSTSPPMHSNWSWDGGTAVTVRPGETVDSLSRKYGVPATAIVRANGLTAGSMLHAGQHVVIPRYSYGSVVATGTPVSYQPARTMARGMGGGSPTALRGPRGAGTVHVVQAHETLISIARHHGKTVSEIAAANRIPPYTRVKMGERIFIPGSAVADAPKQTATIFAPTRAQSPLAIKRLVYNNIEQQPQNQSNAASDAQLDDDAGAPTGSAGLRWPVRGRVISRFHERLDNGQLNEGINISVPDGTAVRAAEDGVVAYAGSELKVYGNLILLRHSNGLVTAYANAGDLLVKHGDQVRRGQVIAHAGETGAVKSPQLHFETRRGSTPVDPMQYLPAGG